MPQPVTIEFASADIQAPGTIVVFAGEDGALGEEARKLDAAADGLLTAAIEAHEFKGKRGKSLVLAMPRGLNAAALVIMGLGKPDALTAAERVEFGGSLFGALPGTKERAVAVFAEMPDGPMEAAAACDIALGITLRAYAFDRYKTKKDEEPAPRTVTISLAGASPEETRERWAATDAIAQGVLLARDLTNEPANVLGPVEFAERIEGLRETGLEVEILDAERLEALEMRALLGVAQGSVRPARVAVMRWNGAGTDAAPVALVGKGVVFDTGGISIKPAGGMEDMKGDMGGAAAVVGAMRAVAGRKAKANVVGIVGLVENMPDGNAQRPGDVVKSKSGQTIEIINTDAEGRLVLADLLTHTIEAFKPKVVIDLATLTGAVIIALGHHHAGLFSNDDEAAGVLLRLGEATGERVWRLPLSKDYDKAMDSKIADMKNTGGRAASSITAAQFLQRFVGEQPWVHLDVAGTAMAAGNSETSRTFGTGFGVRLLDAFVAEHEGEAPAVAPAPIA